MEINEAFRNAPRYTAPRITHDIGPTTVEECGTSKRETPEKADSSSSTDDEHGSRYVNVGYTCKRKEAFDGKGDCSRRDKDHSSPAKVKAEGNSL